jgi:hypothetical protein
VGYHAGSYILTFRLPKAADQARFGGLAAGCGVDIDGHGGIAVRARSREAVFDQGGRVLLACCPDLAPLIIPCTVHFQPREPGDGRDWLRIASPSDAWTIIVGAPVAFTPTGLDPAIPDIGRIGAVTRR